MTIKNGNRMTWIRSLTATVVALMAMGLCASAASAITFRSVYVTMTDPSGAPMRQAGSHPDVKFHFTVPTVTEPDEYDNDGLPVEQFHRVKLDLPLGLVGNATVAETCSEVDLSGKFNGTQPACSTASQVGTAQIGSKDAGVGFGVYNMVPPAGSPAMFGFNAFGVVIKLLPSVRAGDYGITMDTGVLSQGLPLAGSTVTLWGVPADPAHDQLRYFQETDFPSPAAAGQSPRKAFLSASTSCSATADVFTARLDGWRTIGQFDTRVLTGDNNGVPFVNTGCDRLPFDPSIDVRTSTTAADAPTGLDVDLKVPQSDAPNGLATAHVKDVTMALPAGMSISPSAANGLEACTDAQLDMSSDAPERCPDASKLGTVTVVTPLLEEPLSGTVYAGSQLSDDPQSGKMFRIFLTAVGPAVRLKLEGAVRADPATGQLTATFANNPQLPFSSLRVSFDGGPRGVLANPVSCGAKPATAQLTSWSGKAVELAPSFDVACRPGLGGFAPSLTAGTVNAKAGAFAPLALAIAKPDGQAAIDGLSMVMPRGLLAQLKGNLNTRVGSVKAFAGSGSNPFVLPGKVLLEGAYGDAPFSLRVVVPAKAGPFDLGEVVVRQKIYVDPITAQVTVVSDPIPTIVKGVPTRLQRLEVSVDKAGFMINPTSCAAREISATLTAAGGASVPVVNRFQVGDCAALAVAPKLDLTLTGRGETVDGKHPGVVADLTQAFGGQANLKRVSVRLPKSLALDPDNANGLCEFVDGSKVTPTCPKESIVGRATAVTPILDEPLSGPVYFVKNVRKDPKSGRDIRTLPKLVIPMVGQNGVKLTITGTSDVVDDRLVTTFDNIPDAAVTGFKLAIDGGKAGILVVSGDKADICKATQIADREIDGHNNKQADGEIYLKTPACPTKIIAKSIGKRSVKLKIGGLGAGKVTVTGRGIKKASRTITRSTVVTVTARRTTGQPGRFKVKFTPAASAAKAKAAVAR